MKLQHIVALDHNYGLWYERRRDDHQRVRRLDGDVWAPFYELPFARSGKGFAYDGLSQYDLTKWNVWYWKRLKRYADLAEQKGLILFNQHYFQHNILEAGAHWADFPWRTANNVNETGFPEPPNYAGDKRIYMAEQFYDIQQPVRRALHRQYIRQCLSNAAAYSSVIHFIGNEFTGPKAFVEFWLDVVAEWEKEPGKHVLVALSVTKDVQDAILEDPVRSQVVDMIDTKYWEYLPHGDWYAPEGGKNLAPRQHERLRSKGYIPHGGKAPSERAKTAVTRDELMYWTVRDYTDAYPGKAVIYASDQASVGWPAFMAGGSVCSLPEGLPEAFLTSAVSMRPMDVPDNANYWLMGNPKTGYVVYVRSGKTVSLNRKEAFGRLHAQWLDARTGYRVGSPFQLRPGKDVTVKVPANTFAVLWLYH